MMELNLHRKDYIQVGTTSQSCMKLLPSAGEKSSKQRMVVGDHDGVLQILTAKKGGTGSVFKSLPGATQVNRVQLGGQVGGVHDKIFVAMGTTVIGYRKTGKQFLKFDTNLSEPIKSMYVEGVDLLVCGQYTFNHYKDCKDANYFLSADVINDVLCLPSEKHQGSVIPVLGCQDRELRVLDGSDLLYELETAGPVSVLSLFQNDGGKDGFSVIYGTSDGIIGLVDLDPASPSRKWEIRNERKLGGIAAIDHYDMTADGVKDLIIGRDDGSIEIHGYNADDEPILRFFTSLGESITAVQCGTVGSVGYDEIVCTTYTGWVCAFTTEQQQLAVYAAEQETAPTVAKTTEDDSANITNEIAALTTEVEQLQQKVMQERERYSQAVSTPHSVSAVPLFNVNDKFILLTNESCYQLTLEVQTPIDNVLLQSSVPIDLVDVDKNSAVISYSSCQPGDGNHLLATYRCQANTTRLEIRIRTIEGQHGIIQAYVTPRMQPKVCQVKSYAIKPLSLHQRTHSFEQDKPWNTLKLSGPFNVAEIHSWIATCLPEMPERPPSDQTVVMTFRSTFIGSQLQCVYSDGKAMFQSENISTISILKDVLSNKATGKSIRLEIDYDLDEDSVDYILNLVHPKLSEQKQLVKKAKLVGPLKELAMNEQDSSDFKLSAEFQDILANADSLELQANSYEEALRRLYGIYTDLFIDLYKFRGENVKSKVPSLIELLDDYSLDRLLEFFKK